MTDREKIELLRNALAKLMYECRTHYQFGINIEEKIALDYAEEVMSLTEV